MEDMKSKIVKLCDESFDKGAEAVFESIIETLNIVKLKFGVTTLTIDEVIEMIQTAQNNTNEKEKLTSFKRN